MCEAREVTHGIRDVEDLVGPTPEIYSGDASLYVLRAGVRLLQTGRADFLYLSTTDFMQHAYAPNKPPQQSSTRPQDSLPQPAH